MKYVLVIVTILTISQQSVSSKNIVQNIISLNKAPDLRPLKEHLGYYEDTYLNFTELATKYGYPSEEHTVTSEDGYILTIFRILPKCNEVKGYPVLLMHGIIDSSDGWIIPKPNQALGYVLANNCYDVWALNNRGNVYSRKHVRWDPDHDPQYWNFSFEETGYYDIPAIIDYILLKTQKKKISYIGHSQGTTDLLITGSLKPEYNEKVQLSILIAPIAWLSNMRSPLPIILAKHYHKILSLLREVGISELSSKHEYFPHETLEFLCQALPIQVCGTLAFITVGDPLGLIQAKTLSVLYGHILVGLSVKTLVHYAQLINSKRFQRFDEGKEENLKKYGTIGPPQYNVSHFTSPTLLIGAKNDWLSDLKDVETLRSKLPNLLETYIVPDPMWSHNAHVWGSKAPEYDFSKILQYLHKFSNR